MATKIALTIPRSLDGLLSRYRAGASAQFEHRHAELELDHVIRGTARYRVGSRVVSLSARDVLWVFPSQDHGVVEQTDDFEMWIGSKGIYGFISCVALVLAAKQLRRIVKRDRDYYDD